MLTAANDPWSSCPAQAHALNTVLFACGHARNVGAGPAGHHALSCSAGGSSGGNANVDYNAGADSSRSSTGRRPSLPLINVDYQGNAKASTCPRIASAVQSAVRHYTTRPAVESAAVECVGAGLVVNPANLCQEVAETLSTLAKDFDARDIKACEVTTATSTPTTTPTTGTTTTTTATATVEINPTMVASNSRLEQSTSPGAPDGSNSFSVTIVLVCGAIVCFIIVMCGLQIVHRAWEEEARVAPMHDSQGAQTHLTVHRDWFSNNMNSNGRW